MDRALRVSVAAPTDAPLGDAPEAIADRTAGTRLPLGVVSAQAKNSPRPRALKKGASERAKSWADVVVGYGFRSGRSDITTWGSRSSLVEAPAQFAAGDGPSPLPTPPLPKRTVRRVPSWAALTPEAPTSVPEPAASEPAASGLAASEPAASEPAATTPELPASVAAEPCDSPAASPAVEIEAEIDAEIEAEIEAATPLPAVTPAAVRGEVWSTATSTNALTHRSTARGTASATRFHQRAPATDACPPPELYTPGWLRSAAAILQGDDILQEEQDQEGEWMALAEAARRATETARAELRRQESNPCGP